MKTNIFSDKDYIQKAKKIEKKLIEKKKLTQEAFQKIEKEIQDSVIFREELKNDYYFRLAATDEIYIYVFKNDSLCFWSDNKLLIENPAADSLKKNRVIKYDNGWYYQCHKSGNLYDIYGLILIKNKYRYQNDYLVNGFQEDFNTANDCRISKEKGKYNIADENGTFLFSLIEKTKEQEDNNLVFLVLLSFILAYIFFISFLMGFTGFIEHKFRKTGFLFVLFPLFLILFRALTFWLKFPDFIYSLDLFGPKYFASAELLPSLGDMLLNVVVLFFISLYIFSRIRRIKKKVKFPEKIKMPLAALLMITVIALYYFVVVLFKGLIVNSSISFDLNNIFTLNLYSLIGFCIISFLLLSFFFAVFTIGFVVIGWLKRLSSYLIMLAILFLLAFIFNQAYLFFETPYLLFLLVFLVFMGFSLNSNGIKFSIKSIITYIILFALVSTFLIYEQNKYKEREKRKLLVMQLSIEQDPIAEYLFSDIEKKIVSDTVISRIIFDKDTDEEKIMEILKDQYFTGFWSKYNTQVTVCKPGQELIIKPENVKTQCDSFFSKMIGFNGIETMNPHLYYLDNGSGRNNYIAAIPYFKMINDTLPIATLYVELYAKFYPKEMGYPELLIDKNIRINKEVYNYSYAKYKNNELLVQYGKLSYPMRSTFYKKYSNEFEFFTSGEYDNLHYNAGKGNEIVISRKSHDLLDIIAPFSYVFIFFCIISFLFIVLYKIPFSVKEISINFKSRLQLSMILVLVISFVIIGFSTLYFIINIYEKKNNDIIIEKAHSVLIEIESKLGEEKAIAPDMSTYIAELLTKFSNVFFTDINVYDLNGMLIASSRPQVFDEGTISKKMDPMAYCELLVNAKTLFVHQEKIGRLEYTSVYVPLMNNENTIIGYINLPYFAKQSELKTEIATFFVTFININVLITALAIIIALLISNYVTRPLRIIKTQMGRFSLGKKNEKIEWKRRDEIGNLILEYNRMIDELSMSAELLARSERESAWREMAKQVAHEIKNPLTPMKLSIQHLQRSWYDKPADWEARLNRFTNTMIEQIDTLSKIASEFSTFAKMPIANIEEIDFIQLIESTIVLYADYSTPIILEKAEGSHIIKADRTQLIRVFNNLIKNSIQAIDEKIDGKIQIIIKQAEDHYLITVKDNGSGIPEEKRDKIFSPYFTTKTGGMGLGLAMVKSIIESMNGKIWFETRTAEDSDESGTSFFFTISKEN